MGQVRNKELINRIALTLKNIREGKGLTLEDVYNETNIHIARIETARVNISVSTLDALCQFYSLSLAEFFRRLEEKR